MKISKNKLINNMSYAFFANLVSLVISTVLILLVPKFVGVSNYGYFQLYLFYTTYISYMSLGITDGIYLRIGGEDYESLDKKILSGQFWFLIFFNIIVDFSFCYFYLMSSNDIDKNNIILATAFVGVLVVPRSLITFVLQATNRIKEFSLIIIIEKVIYFVNVLFILLFGFSDYKLIIYADLLGKIISFIYSVYICRDLVFSKFSKVSTILEEIKINFSVGINLFVSNLSSMMIIGIDRFFIERKWDIETFGKVSLSLSISNMVIVFINAVAVVLFPTLRKFDFETQKKYYSVIRNILMPTLLFSLVLFFPGVYILDQFLPMYGDSFRLMIILFPMVIFEGKTVVLVNTYLKTLREEKIMFKVNILIVFVSFILSFVISNFTGSLDLMVFLILFLLVIRNAILENYLSKLLKINVLHDIIMEIVLISIFIISGLYFSRFTSFILYSVGYLIYILAKKSELLSSINILKNSNK